MMPSNGLKDVKTYLDVDVFDRMETVRGTMRRTSRSRFVQDCIVEKLDRLNGQIGAGPTHEGPRRKKHAA